jgi:signal peptidase I
MKLGSRVLKLTWNCIKYYSFFYVTTQFLIPVEVVLCEGVSMEPTLRHNDVLLSEKISVRKQRLEKYAFRKLKILTVDND